jgi:hypothetical protein
MDNPVESVATTLRNAGDIHRIPGLALQIMLVGILIPTAFYAFNLKNPSPAQLLVAICMSLFSAVIFLWILDATSILRFRSEWVSRSVYGAAIASVLGTSVAVYRDSFAERKYPLEGAWELTLVDAKTGGVVADRRVILSYSEAADAYWGYSNVPSSPLSAASEAMWVEVRRFRPAGRQLSLRLLFANGTSRLVDETLATSDGQRSFEAKTPALTISMSRPTS